ncbi:hypothetical protein ACN2WE_29110 [Streptomyces sp. cg28]|uniref:hypothetical protein n=1 Tax=Streptomyces sp. cg28 TaxID=3403457 RepID=UPI003B210CFB
MVATSSTPELFGAPTASLALAVSALSFTVAFTALAWQVMKHRLDGGRPKVYLNVAIWEPHRSLHVNRNGKWEIPATVGSENLELAQLVVENPGRTAITIYTPAIAIRGTKNRQYTMTPRLFPVKGGGADAATGDMSVRIDPYDRVTFLFDYWSIIPRLLGESSNGTIKLRGCISVAGRNKVQKSSWLHSWKIRAGRWTAQTEVAKISPYTLIWREVFKSNARTFSQADDLDRYPDFSIDTIVRSAMQKFDERPQVEAFIEALEEAAGRSRVENLDFTGVLLNMDNTLDAHADHLGEWPWGTS